MPFVCSLRRVTSGSADEPLSEDTLGEGVLYYKCYFNISVSITTTLLAAESKHEYSKHSKTYIHLKNV